MRNLLLVVIGLALAGCCGSNPELFGAADDCKPVYQAPSCVKPVEPPAAAPQVQSAPFWEGIMWPWECDEARRGEPIYKKPDCAAFNDSVKGFFAGVNDTVFGCTPAPAPVGAAPDCK